MSVIPTLPIVLQNGTTADATQVMANFNAIVAAVNSGAANAGVNNNITALTGLTVALSVAQGGTGQNILTPNAVLIGEGVAGVNGVGPGTAGQVLISNGPGVDPSFGCPYRVGDLYITTLSADPGTFYLGTTWTAYAAGRVLIGVGTGTDANGINVTVSAGETFGEYSHTLTVPEMPSHAHTDAGHAHPVTPNGNSGGPGSGNNLLGSTFNGVLINTQTGYANIQSTGGGGSHNNVQPSIGVYIWQRTA